MNTSFCTPPLRIKLPYCADLDRRLWSTRRGALHWCMPTAVQYIRCAPRYVFRKLPCILPQTWLHQALCLAATV